MRVATVSLLIGFALLLAFTNPTNDDFREWSRVQIVEQYQKAGYGSEANLASGLEVGGGIMEYYMSNVSRSDYAFFSVYTLRIGGGAQTFLGILRQFIPVSGIR